MSGFIEALIELADVNDFYEKVRDVPNLESLGDVAVLIDGDIVQGWKLIEGEPPIIHEDYHLVLRHPADDSIGTAWYIGVVVSQDGGSLGVHQHILIQNDNDDYDEIGFRRYGALWFSAMRPC